MVVESRIELQAVERLILGSVELGLLDARGELTESCAAHELAVTEIGEMAMGSKHVLTVAAVVLMAVGLGIYGLSERVVGQDAADKITVRDPFGQANSEAEGEARFVATRGEKAADNTPLSQQAASPEGARRRLSKAQAILAALDEKELLMCFQDAPLLEVVDYLQTAMKIPIVIDRRSLDDVGLGSNTPVMIDLHDVSVRSALNLMLHELDLDYVVRDEVLAITTAEVARHQLDPRVYPLDGIEIERDQLIEWIPSMVAPETWEEAGGSGKIQSIGRLGSGLLIAQTCQVHGQIAEFFEKLRRAASEEE